MSLEKWAEYGWLKAEPTSRNEIKSLLAIVRRDLKNQDPQRKFARPVQYLSVRVTSQRASQGGQEVSRREHSEAVKLQALV